MTVIRKVVFFSFLFFLPAGVLLAGKPDSTTLKTVVKPGDFAPTFVLQNVEGKSVFLRDYAGTPRQLVDLPRKPVLLSFFASWCKPCRREIPELQKLISQIPPDSLQAFLVNVGDDAEAALKFIADFKTTMPVLLDKYGVVANKYCPQETADRVFLPTLVLIGKDGKIIHTKIGYKDGDMAALEQILKELLKL